ncbi:MAG TPA: hypothetical protein VKR30_03255 [Candidatus Limnocylindrales bacterium]|nr:hypothetical protein [Candidatus Limnocylindrales bacterium]
MFVRFQANADHYDLFSINPDGSDLHAINPGYSIGFAVPRWSSAGTVLAAQSQPNGCACGDTDPLGFGFETILQDAKGTHFHLHLASSTISVSCAAWTPDDKSLACEGWSAMKAGLEGIYTVSASSGGAVTRLTDAPGGFHDVPGDYDATGQIAFVRTTYAVLGLGEIWVANANGSDAHKLTDTLSTYRISWSDDGRWLVGTRDGYLEVFDLTDLTADPEKLSFPGGTASEPRFSPDGSRIVFVFTKAGSKTTSIETVARDGSDLIRLTSGSLDRSPDWGAPGF